MYLGEVRLLSDRDPAEGVAAGETGVVVFVFEGDHDEVEFSNPATGETIALLTLTRAEIEPVARTVAAPEARAGD